MLIPIIREYQDIIQVNNHADVQLCKPKPSGHEHDKEDQPKSTQKVKKQRGSENEVAANGAAVQSELASLIDEGMIRVATARRIARGHLPAKWSTFRPRKQGKENRTLGGCN